MEAHSEILLGLPLLSVLIFLRQGKLKSDSVSSLLIFYSCLAEESMDAS